MANRAPFIQILSSNGDGTGTVNMNGNYSVVPAEFYVQCPAGYTMFITHLHALVADNAALNMADYGAIAGGLINGIAVSYSIGGVVGDFLKGFRIKTNVHYIALGNISLTTFAGSAQGLKCEADFPGQYTDSLMFNSGDWFKATLNDDFSGLVTHMWTVMGALQEI